MAAYGEGLNILKHANIGKTSDKHEKDAETTPLRNPEHHQYDFNLADVSEVWRRGASSRPGCWISHGAGMFVGSPNLDKSRRATYPTPAKGAGPWPQRTTSPYPRTS